VAPRQLVLVHGPETARQALATFARGSRTLRALRTQVALPAPGEAAQLSLSSSWAVELGDDLAEAAVLQPHGGYQLAWLDGQLVAGQQVGRPGRWARRAAPPGLLRALRCAARDLPPLGECHLQGGAELSWRRRRRTGCCSWWRARARAGGTAASSWATCS
jgi:hypothetical protein